MMFTPCWPSAGPTGGAGVAAPALIWSLTIAESFRFLGGISGFLVVVCCEPRTCQPRCEWSDLGDLREGQLDRRLPAEDGDEDLQLLGVDVDLVDRCRERGERPVHHGHRLADLEVDLDRGLAGRGGPGRAAPARGGRL